MAKISDRKLKIIKRRYGQQSVSEIARDLDLREKDVRDAAIELGLEKPKGRDAAASQFGEQSLKWTIAAAVILLVLTAVCFRGAVDSPLVFDDHHSIRENQYIRDSRYFGQFFVDPAMFSNEPDRKMYRPIVLLTYALNYAIGKEDTKSYHILDFLIHALNGLLIFLILELLLRDKRLSLLLSALFVIHPITVEGVVYLSSRSTLIAGTSIFGAVYLFLRQAQTGGNSRTVVAAFLFLIGLMSKENAFMLPPILLVAEYVLGNGFGDFFEKQRWKVHAWFWSIAGIYMFWRKFGLKLNSVVLSRPERSFSLQIFTQMGVWLDYLKKILWPVGLNSQPTAVVAKAPWLSGVGITDQPIMWLLMWAVLGTLIFLGRRNRLMIWGVAFSALILVPETITAMNQLSNERRVYLPLFGMMVVAGSLYNGVEKKRYKNMVLALGCLILFCMAPLCMQRVDVWKTEKSLWFDSIRKKPESELSWHGLGYVYSNREPMRDEKEKIKNLNKALWALEHALKIDPNYPLTLRLKGALLLSMDKLAEALPSLKRSVELEPLSHRGWYNLGLAQQYVAQQYMARHPESGLQDALNAYGDTIKSYRESIRLNKFYAQPHHNLAVICAQLGDPYHNAALLDEAYKEFEEACRLDKTEPQYCNNFQAYKAMYPQLKAKTLGMAVPTAPAPPGNEGEEKKIP